MFRCCAWWRLSGGVLLGRWRDVCRGDLRREFARSRGLVDRDLLVGDAGSNGKPQENRGADDGNDAGGEGCSCDPVAEDGRGGTRRGKWKECGLRLFGSGARYAKGFAAGGAGGEVAEDLLVLAGEERVFSKGGEKVGVGMRTGIPRAGQLTAQRVGVSWLHVAEPSLL